jgi:hypothetical protein
LHGSSGHYEEWGYKPWRCSCIFYDCYHLACDFIKISFEHVPREANVVAHDLARAARSSPLSVWMEDAPDFILSFLLDDVRVVCNK